MKYSFKYSFGTFDYKEKEIELNLSPETKFGLINSSGNLKHPRSHPYMVITSDEQTKNELLKLPTTCLKISDYFVITINRCVPPEELICDDFESYATNILKDIIVCFRDGRSNLCSISKIFKANSRRIHAVNLIIRSMYGEECGINEKILNITSKDLAYDDLSFDDSYATSSYIPISDSKDQDKNLKLWNYYLKKIKTKYDL